MIRKISILCFSLLFTITSLTAGITGKISGQVTNTADGEPVVGVNIILAGTILGAASDLSGNYVILNIPPGVYDLNISAIGYANVTVRGVRVEIDLTTPVDIGMQTEALAGEEVVVFAETRIIKEDVAASQKSISADHIIDLPANSITDVLSLEAGITSSLGIRGSGSDQVLLIVDGIPLRDERDNSPITSLPLSAVNEISVQTGGFRAEYSNVRSGIINIVTKEGDPNKYTFTISGEYSPAAPKHFGISPFDENAFWLRPYLDPAVAWTGTSNGETWTDLNKDGVVDTGEYADLNGDGEWTYWDRYDRRQYKGFEGWIAVSERTLADTDPANDLSPTAAQKIFRWEHRLNGFIEDPDYNLDLGFGGPVPLVSSMLGNLRFYASGKSNY
ncbi:MAG: carboxypeptidase-like regulatory domain-containing protein, partial [Candidatus Marinimicrobia bacterium]|nr:carboxypeptidase-like regulatory domain-containing protein [Candidatus Neomarinimicrobiota bacterium]